MRKGVILEHKSRSTIVMTGKGEFIKAQKISGAEIGEEVTFEPKPASSFGFFTYKRTSAATIAIIIIISLFPAYFWYGDNKAYAYVSIDINPSFEAKVNQDMEVISIEPLNEDAESSLKNFEGWKGEPLTSVTSQLFEVVKNEGYVSNGENALVGVSYLSGQGDLDIIKKIQGFFEQQDGSFQVAAYAVPYEWIEEAKKAGKSVHAIVNQRLIEDEEAIELETDARDLIHSFFRTEENEQKETVPSEENMEEDTEEETGKPASSLQNNPQEKQERKESGSEATESSSSSAGKSAPSSESSLNKDKKEKDKKATQANNHSSPFNNGKSTGSKGEGPPEKGEDHPRNKGEGHSDNKGNGPPSVQSKEDHPSNKKEENRSSNQKNGSERNKSETNGKGHGPPEK